jgi:hypothetical protein
MKKLTGFVDNPQVKRRRPNPSIPTLKEKVLETIHKKHEWGCSNNATPIVSI